MIARQRKRARDLQKKPARNEQEPYSPLLNNNSLRDRQRQKKRTNEISAEEITINKSTINRVEENRTPDDEHRAVVAIVGDRGRDCDRDRGENAKIVDSPLTAQTRTSIDYATNDDGDGDRDGAGEEEYEREQEENITTMTTWTTTTAAVITTKANQTTTKETHIEQQQQQQQNDEGHFEYKLGDSLGENERFKILAPLGEGTFGKVLECYDRVKQEYCAVKLIRNVPKYKAAAKIEVDVLNEIGRRDPNDDFHCIRLKESFEHEGHSCLMFDKYGLSLFDFMKKNNYKPFSPYLVQTFAKQLLKAVAFMHELKMTHTDLKPENILLESPGYVRQPVGGGASSSCTTRVPVSSAIKLIDFGSTTSEEQYHSTVVSTRHYRAPEIIMGTGWSYPCDLWSVGCIMIELLTGDALFQTHENMEHLAMMRKVLGPIPASVLKRASQETIEKFFCADTSELNWPEGAKDMESERAVQAVQPLDILIRERFENEEMGTLLRHLLSRLLEYDPETRISAKDALNHSFFRLDIAENNLARVSNNVATNNNNVSKDKTSVARNMAAAKTRSQTTGGVRASCLPTTSSVAPIIFT